MKNVCQKVSMCVLMHLIGYGILTKRCQVYNHSTVFDRKCFDGLCVCVCVCVCACVQVTERVMIEVDHEGEGGKEMERARTAGDSQRAMLGQRGDPAY